MSFYLKVPCHFIRGLLLIAESQLYSDNNELKGTIFRPLLLFYIFLQFLKNFSKKRVIYIEPFSERGESNVPYIQSNQQVLKRKDYENENSGELFT